MWGSAALHGQSAVASSGLSVTLDIAGRRFDLDPADAARLRDAAAARAGTSSSARDLSLLIDRAMQGRHVLALRRAEAQTLMQLASDIDLAIASENPLSGQAPGDRGSHWSSVATAANAKNSG